MKRDIEKGGGGVPYSVMPVCKKRLRKGWGGGGGGGGGTIKCHASV